MLLFFGLLAAARAARGDDVCTGSDTLLPAIVFACYLLARRGRASLFHLDKPIGLVCCYR